MFKHISIEIDSSDQENIVIHGVFYTNRFKRDEGVIKARREGIQTQYGYEGGEGEPFPRDMQYKTGDIMSAVYEAVKETE